MTLSEHGPRFWRALVMPSAALVDFADRERSRVLSALLAVLIGCGLLSGLVQLLFIADFARTFRPMAAALCGISVAYGLSRTRHYRLGAGLTTLLVIAACVVVRIANPHDHVWHAFMLIGVLISATFLTLSWAVASAVLALAATVLGFALSSGFSAVDEWLPALMLHIVLSPLLLVLSHQRARLEARRIEQLRERDLKLIELQHLETLDRFAAGVAHDFNNLICIVSMNAAYLLGEREFREHAIVEVGDAAARAKRLVEQLVAFARKQPPTPRPISMNQIITELLPILRRVAGEQVHLKVHNIASVPDVWLDPVQLERIIINLVVNARDAMPSGGVLEIETSASPQPSTIGVHQSVVLRVRDSGVGMDTATRSAIFEPFFTTKGDAGGSGLGLAIVQAIVHQAGGQIGVESELGRGTTFEIVFPCT